MYNIFHLGNNDSACVFYRFRHRERFKECRFFFHRQVAVFIGVRATDNADMDLFKRFVTQVLFPVDFHDFHEILFRDFVHLSTLQAWIDKRVQPDLCNDARTLGGDFPKQLRQRSDWKVVRLDFVFRNEFLNGWNQIPVSADNATKQSFVSQMVHPEFVGSVAYIGWEKQVDVFWMPLFEKPVFHRVNNFLRETHSDKPANDDAVPVFD